MTELLGAFPYLENEEIVTRKIESSDIAALSEISSNDHIYKYIPSFLYRKGNETLETVIKSLGGKDFEKKKYIIAGVYLKGNPDRLVGLVEIFGYKERENKIIVGYRLSEDYWNKEIITSVLELMVDCLVGEARVATLQALIMSKNICSSKVLLNNGFVEGDFTIQEKNRDG